MGDGATAGSERRGRARLLAGALVVESVGGLMYAFSLYSETLKRTYGLSQGAVQTIGTAANIGGNVGVHAGIFYDAFGPRATVLVALVLGGAGWGGMWLVLATRWPAPLGLLVALGAIQGHAQMISDCAVVPTIARTFAPEQCALSSRPREDHRGAPMAVPRHAEPLSRHTWRLAAK